MYVPVYLYNFYIPRRFLFSGIYTKNKASTKYMYMYMFENTTADNYARFKLKCELQRTCMLFLSPSVNIRYWMSLHVHV